MEDHDHHSHHAEHTQHGTHATVNDQARVIEPAAQQFETLPHDIHTGAEAEHSSGDLSHRSHTDHSGHEEVFRKRFWICLLLTIPVLLYSPMIQEILGFQMPAFWGSQWIPAILSITVFIYGGLPFLQMAVPEIRNRQPGMMTLISLAISVAFIYSILAEFLNLGEGFFWELVTLIDIMLLGHWLEMRSVRQASGALDELAKLLPDTAEMLMEDGSTHQVPISSLKRDNILLVRPGASIPADGEVTEGHSSVNESMLTGESKPVDKSPGVKVVAGTINGDGSLRVRVTAVGEQTALAGIMRLVRQAQMSKSQTQLLADKAAGWLFYTALIAATLTAIGWTIASGFDLETLNRVITVLVIACPHALGLAIPLVVAISTTLAAGNGILVRDRLALETSKDIDLVLFDKTGTLTRGEHGLTGIAVADAVGGARDENQVLSIALAIEADSEHLIAKAIRKAALDRGIIPVRVSHFEAIKGRGVRASMDGKEVYLGGPNLLEMLGVAPGGTIIDFTDEANQKGQTVVYLVVQDQVAAAFALADLIRAESKTVVDRLQSMGVKVAMLTGDSQDVAKAVADELGINEYFTEVLPEHKEHKVAELQSRGYRVAMVGDGVNDAPALTRADVGIAIGGGTDVAIESAGIILVKDNPLDVINIVRLSRASYRKMVQNLAWATGYNIIAIPLAAGVLAPFNILLTPAMGALLMSLSTIIVAVNAQLLRRLKFG